MPSILSVPENSGPFSPALTIPYFKSSGSLLPSPVLAAMQVPDAVLRSALRFSLGEGTTEAEIVAAAERIAASVLAGQNRRKSLVG